MNAPEKVTVCVHVLTCRILDSHNVDYEEIYLLGHNAV
jgi:hypothetical protein